MAVTSREIMKSLGIKNIKTLTRWHQYCVIPEPTVENHPGGIGRIGCWPDWVLEHCRVIKQLVAEGQTLRQVADTFGDDWNAIARRYQRYSFAEVNKKMDLENKVTILRESIQQELARDLGDLRERLKAATIPPINRDLLMRAVDLVREGYNPVLIVTSERIIVTPDFLVGLHLAAHFENPKTLLVVPLFSRIQGHLKAKDLPKAPTIRPASYIYRQTKQGLVEELIELKGEWQFQMRAMESSGAKKKKK